MSILANRYTRVLIQGITGMQASFHVKRSIEGGTRIVAGVSPYSEGEKYFNASPKYDERECSSIPVFKTVREAQKYCHIDASVLFVPANGVKSAVKEAIKAEIPLVVSIAQGVPVHDMLEIKAMLADSDTLMIGPNTPGLITPGEARLGIFPENIHKKGSVGIISRSSTLTYEAVLETNAAGLGQSTVIGLGDDMIIGSDFREMIRRFMVDDETEAVVLIGKADNAYELLAAECYYEFGRRKPVIAFVAGEALPYHNYNIGYAADIITHGRITVSDKKRIMRESGMIVADNMGEIHSILKNLRI